MCAGITAALIKPDAGNETTYIGSESYAELNGLIVVDSDCAGNGGGTEN